MINWFNIVLSVLVVGISSLSRDPERDVCDGLKPGDCLQAAWTTFKEVHHRTYSGPEEEQERWKIFEKNARAVIAHNEDFRLGRTTFTEACNKFTDLRPDEMRQHMGYRRPKKSTTA